MTTSTTWLGSQETIQTLSFGLTQKFMASSMSEWDGMPMDNPYNMPIFSCKLKNGNKNRSAESFAKMHKCPGNCDICKASGHGCVVGESSYADEH